MGFTAIAIVSGLVAGVALGGRLRHLASVSFRWWPVFAAGIATQIGSSMVDGAAGFGLLITSYAALIAFAVANLRFGGMGLIAIGIGMNLATIGVNGGMPVRAEAIVAAGIAGWEEIDDLDFGSKRHLEGDGDHLMALSDIIPVPGVAEVLSFGDLVMSVGMAVLITNLLRPPPRARREPAAPVVDLRERDLGGALRRSPAASEPRGTG